MKTLESAEVSAVSSVLRAKGALAGGSTGVFAAVFESARRSASRLAEVMTQRAREEVGAIGRRQERQDDALSESRRGDAAERGSQRASPDKPSRVDRLRSSVREAERGRAQTDDASSPRQDAPVSVAGDGGPELDQELPTQVDEHAAGGCEAAVGPNETDQSAPEPRREPNAETAEFAAGRETSEAESGVCVPGPAGPVAPSIAGPKATPGGQAVSSNRTAAAPSVSNPTVFIQQHQASGREAGSGQLQDAARGDGSKAGGSAGRPGAASNDFQQVLDAAGRMRGRLTTLRSAATSVAGVRSTGAGNINLEESRSISELARVVRSNIGPRHSTMILRLDPPELGQLRIDVRMHDQMLTLRLEAHTPAGHEALQSRLSELRGALERQGIQLNQVEVELRPPSSPAMGTQDAGAHQESASEWDEPASRDSGAGSETGAGGGRPGSAGDADETTTFSGGGELPEEHRHGDMGRPAETGVDLVV